MTLAIESWLAVFGGLIPIAGLAAVAWLLWYAVREPPEEKESGSDEGGST